MWGTILRFVAWVISKAWSIGVQAAYAVANWAKANYVRVYNWIMAGIAWEVILQWIRNILGI